MVTPRFAPFTGGVETHVGEVSRRLVDRGVDVLVVTTDPTGDLSPTDTIDGVPVRRVRAWPRNSDAHLAPGLARWVRAAPGTVVHVQGYHTLVAPLAMTVAAMRSVPYVVTFHSGGQSASWRNRIRPVQALAMRPLFGRAARLIAVSSFEADLFRRRLHLPDDRFVVVPNGSDLPVLDSVEGAVELERDRDLVVSVGRLEHYKGHQRVVAALPVLATIRPAIRLVVAGSGPYEDALRAEARAAGVSDRLEIRSYGPEERGELHRLLRRAGAVAVLSEYESQGIAAHEALAAGAPLVASDTTALAELGARGLARMVSTEAGSDAVASALLAAIEDGPPPTRPELPSWDAAADALHAIYRTVLTAG